jgi:uncharacterized protein (UPF0147 family)
MANYAERFEAAINALVGDGPVKQRLTRAYSDFLEPLQDHELPVNIRNAVSDLHAALHRVSPMGQETCVKASVQKMSVLEATRHAQSIVRVYAQLLTLTERAEPLKVVENQDAQPPRYLVATS